MRAPRRLVAAVHSRARKALAVASAMLIASSTGFAASPDAGNGDDPFRWLEEVDGTRAMEWVAAENARTAAVLESDPRYRGFFDQALAIAQAKDRIPDPQLLGGQVMNFWRDAEHVRGIWRRTSLADYERAEPAWQTVLDLDAAAKAKGTNWFWSGVDCDEPAERRCMIALSDGGEDAATLREFDLATSAFVDDGFVLPRGKQVAAWDGRNSLLVAREWSPGELTRSSYPYVLKRLGRGQPLSAAVEVFRGSPDDVGVGPTVLNDGEGHRLVVVERRRTTFEADYYLVGPTGTRKLALPAKAELTGLVAGRVVVNLREDWSAGGRIFPLGSLVSVDLARMIASPEALQPTLIYAPGPREAFLEASTTRAHLIVTTLDNVNGRAYVYTPVTQGKWTRRELAFPDKASVHIVNTSLHSDLAFLSVEGFLAPLKLWVVDARRGAPRAVKTLPPRFDASRDRVDQFEATSTDGTRVPYFVVHPVDMKMDGSTPTILSAYGGFLVAETPYYSGNVGKLWLERGGAYVVANIRGGGEFGPAWHDAGLKTQRQRIYDDFAAVARDLIARGITSPAHLGIVGGSNGGLLMGVEMIQHPDLWAAIDMQVPLLDMLGYERIAAGSSWVGEYGSVSNPDEKAFLASISPYETLSRDVRYPEALIWTTTKDDRVGPQHARKFAAKLASIGAPYLFYEIVQGGHSSGATQAERAAMTAREYTYFARKLGLP